MSSLLQDLKNFTIVLRAVKPKSRKNYLELLQPHIEKIGALIIPLAAKTIKERKEGVRYYLTAYTDDNAIFQLAPLLAKWFELEGFHVVVSNVKRNHGKSAVDSMATGINFYREIHIIPPSF